MLTSLRRRTLIATAAAAASVVLVGCIPILPSRPLAIQPISVTAVNDRLSWVQCSDDDIRINYVTAVITEESGQEREWTVLVAEGDSEDAVRVAPEVPVDLDRTFAGLPVLASNDVALSSLQGSVTVFLVMADPDVRAEMAFENIDVSTLADGRFIYPSGEVSDSPCAMPAD